MCTENKQDAISAVQTYLTYVKEDVDSALHNATKINDPELNKQLTEIKSKAQGVKDYITSKTDPKTLG